MFSDQITPLFCQGLCHYCMSRLSELMTKLLNQTVMEDDDDDDDDTWNHIIVMSLRKGKVDYVDDVNVSCKEWMETQCMYMYINM